jgi:invasion protein IalB
MKTLFKLACLMGFFAFLGAIPAVAETSLPGGASSVQETFESWTVNCIHQNKAKRCGMSQEQVDQHSRQRVIAIEFNVTPPGKQLRGTLIMPFGLALEHAIKLQVDNSADVEMLRVRTCVPIGCLVDLDFDANFVAALRKGTNLNIDAVADGGKEAKFAISLKGFPAALDRTIVLSK